MKEIVVTIEAPPDVSIRVIRKEAPSRLRVSPRGKVGKPVETFVAAFSALSTDGATAPAEAVRDHFAITYPSTGKNRPEAIKRAWRRALALVEDGFTVESAGGVEVFRKVEGSPISRSPASSGSGKTGASVPSISATRGARTPRSGRGG